MYLAFATESCPSINIDGSRGVPDAVKPLVSTHLERMSLTDYSVISSQLLIATGDRIHGPNH
jgi:hypothetical protein